MIHRGKKALGSWVLSLLLLSWFIPTADAYSLYSRAGSIEASLGVGLTLNPPIRLDLELNGEYFWRDEIAFGLDVDLFFRGATAFSFVPYAAYYFQIDRWPRLAPYVGAGVGGGGTTSGNGFLDIMIPSLGFKWEWITGKLFVGPDFEFHLQTDFDNTEPDFHMLVRATYRF